MRAIDGDALLKRVQQEEIQAQVHGREFSTCFLSPGGTPSTEWWYVEDLIENAPTIEPERKKGKWIPCSERLPDEKDARILKKLGIEKRSEDVLATVEVKGERMTVTTCTYDGKWEWDMKYAFPDYKVIAWMPLPEPYGGDQNVNANA